MKKLSITPILVVLLALSLTACSAVSDLVNAVAPQSAAAAAPTTVATQPAAASSAPAAVTQPQQPTAAPAPVTQPGVPNSFLAAYEGTLESIYAQVSPSVVSIHVIAQSSTSSANPLGRGRNGGGSQVTEGLGSGFVWDIQGNIVTNNHVVSGATSVDVTFSDGKNVPAKVVGTDVYSDLAVIKVEVPAARLHPVTLANSKLTKVGELAIAIGNPYGLQNTMTVGIVSALGRSLPAGSGLNPTGPSYTIPDVIQTDAPINPGNSGGVLLDDQSQVLGVTAAIESASSANAGIGFVIPANIVARVVPSLIQTGAYQHPYLGISGMSLTSDIINAMKLNANQQGALVQTITTGGPADKAGLKGSSQPATINGQSAAVGGDIITAINGQSIKSMDDLIAYLENSVSVGQKVTLTVLRGGKEMSIDLTVGARPSQPAALLPGNSGDANAQLLGFPAPVVAPVLQ